MASKLPVLMIAFAISCKPTTLDPSAPSEPPSARAQPLKDMKPAAGAIEVGGMGLTWNQEQYLARFGSMSCGASEFVNQRRPKVPLNQWHMEESKVKLPITRCAINCPQNSLNDAVVSSHEVFLYQGKTYRVRFRPCDESITLAVAADTYAKKIGAPVQIVEAGFSNGIMGDLDGFEIDLDRGHIIATANWPHVPGGKVAAQQSLGLIEWSNVDQVDRMRAEIDRQEAAGENAAAQAAAKKVDL